MSHFVRVLIVAMAAFWMEPLQAGCASGTPGPDIVPCPPETWSRVERPTCHPAHQVYEIYGHMDYWNEFMSPVDRSCELEIEYHGADVISPDAVFQQDTQCFCPARRVLIWPWYVWNRTTAQSIGGQMDYMKRRFKARGCFIDEAGLIFVANAIDYHIPR